MHENQITILDGGMGRELEKRGAPFKQPEWSALAMMQAPEIVTEVHQAFIDNGSDIITTNSYSLVPFHIGEEAFAKRGLALIEASGQVAQAVAKKSAKNVRVAGSIPPLFGSYRADLYVPERVAEIVSPLIAGLDNYADFWLLETQSLISEATAVIEQIKLRSKVEKSIWVSFTIEDAEETEQPLLRSGEKVVDAVEAMTKLGVEAILFNCSQPEIIEEALIVAKATLIKCGTPAIKLGAYGNAFPPQPKDATANDGLDELRADITPLAYAKMAQQWIDNGATLIGGCCGIGPEYIAELAQSLKD
ncbi:MAG: homocysteine S-methyltransferase family protein [Gammaproteobacteria bacterium]|nr:homocysteine S-methyltransferase family protein [Gammaproteobacteria bacterium]